MALIQKGNRIRPQCVWVEIIIQEKTSSRFWRSVFPIFGKEKDEFPATAVRILSDENSLNQFYILYVWGKVFIVCHAYISLKKVKKTSLGIESNSASSDVLTFVYTYLNEKDNDVEIVCVTE